MTSLDVLVAACRALLEHRQAEPGLIAAKDAALVAMASELGQPAKAERAAYRRLVEDGWSDEDIARVGVSEAMVRAAIRKERG